MPALMVLARSRRSSLVIVSLTTVAHVSRGGNQSDDASSPSSRTNCLSSSSAADFLLFLAAELPSSSCVTVTQSALQHDVIIRHHTQPTRTIAYSSPLSSDAVSQPSLPSSSIISPAHTMSSYHHVLIETDDTKHKSTRQQGSRAGRAQQSRAGMAASPASLASS